MALQFQSVGGAVSNALEQFLMQRMAQERQRQLDTFAREKEANDVAASKADQVLRARALDQEQQRMTAAEADRKAAAEDLHHQREFTQASTVADHAMPGDPADEATQALLQRQGFGGMLRQIPGLVVQGPLESGDGADQTAQDHADQLGQGPDQTVLRGGAKWLNAEAERQAKAERAAQEEAGRNDRAAAANELRALIAQMGASGKAESAALANQLRAIQIRLLGDKVDAAEQERKDKAGSVASGRASVRELAQGLLHDPALEAISGPAAGRTPDLLPASVDAARRLEQLVGMLSLESRGKMKGQGQISDFEGRLLASSVSALDRKAGAANVRKHLQEIYDAFQGDTPNAGTTPASPVPQSGGSFKVIRRH